VKGDRCIDLLSSERGKELVLANDASGVTQLLGATSADINSANEFLRLIESAKSRRTTHATGANAVSSRSHAVCQLELLTRSSPDGKKRKVGYNIYVHICIYIYV